jgi:hypothetical protein
MTEGSKGTERVTFSRGYDVCIMAIDGTWRRDCQLNAISDSDATLTVEGSIQGLNLKEFFLLLSSTGLAYRRCELVRVNGTEMDIRFLRGKPGPERGKGDVTRQKAARRVKKRRVDGLRPSRRSAPASPGTPRRQPTQSRTRLRVARRHVIQHDDVGGDVTAVACCVLHKCTPHSTF